MDCGEDWSWEHIERMVERGPHQTTCTPEAWELFKKDIEYQKAAGFCTTVLWDDIKGRKDLRKLKILPAAAIP